MTYKRAECLIFVPNSRATRGTQNTAQQGNSVRGYVLLSSEFIEQHPKLVQLFDKNSLLIVQNRDVPRLPTTDKEMDFVSEIFLDDSPSASVDPLSISTDHEDTSFVPRLICNTTVTLSRKVWKASDMRPAVDDSNREAFRRLVARSFPLGSDTGGILHLATSRRQEVLMRTALENGAEINGKSKRGATALHLAAREGSISLMKVLLEKGAAVNVYDLDGTSPLYGACRHSAKLVQLLLDKGAEVNDESRTPQNIMCRDTPLTIAARNGKPEMVQMLLKRGAAINKRNGSGYTPLLCASEVKVQKILLQSGADPNSAIESLFSPFWRGSLESMEMLLDYGAQVDLRNLVKPYYGYNSQKLQLILEYCFIDPETLTSQLCVLRLNEIGRRILYEVLFCIGEHVVIVMALHGLTDLRNVDVEELWEGDGSDIAEFRQKCDAEVASMKRHKFSGTDVSMRDALARSDYHLYRLLKNPTVTRAINPALILRQYPIYGSILNHHFRKGRHRRWLQREGVKSLKLLSLGFHRLPDEILEEIVGCLSTVDILKLRRASAGQS